MPRNDESGERMRARVLMVFFASILETACSSGGGGGTSTSAAAASTSAAGASTSAAAATSAGGSTGGTTSTTSSGSGSTSSGGPGSNSGASSSSSTGGGAGATTGGTAFDGGLCNSLAGPENPSGADGGITALTAGASANCVTVDSTYIYWSDARGAILKIPISGGASEAVTPCLSNAPQGIAVDSANVYFTIPATGFVMRADLKSGAPVAIASGEPSPSVLAIDSQYAYWGWSGTFAASPAAGIHAVSLDGGTVIGGVGGAYQNWTVWDVATGPSEVGWTASRAAEDGVTNIVQIAEPSSAVEGVSDTTFQGYLPTVYGITLDANNVYWTQPAYNDGTFVGPGCPAQEGGAIMSMALDGGAVSTLATGLISNPGAVIVKSETLYWIEHGSAFQVATDAGSIVNCVSAGLYRLSLDGGDPELTAQQPGDAFWNTKRLASDVCIAADDTSIYWIIDGQIVKAPR